MQDLRPEHSLLPPRAVVVATCLTSSATLGLLFGIGRRSGRPWQALNAAAFTLLRGQSDGVMDFTSDVTLAGVAVVLVMSAVAAVVTARLISSRRTFHCAMAASGVALAGYLAHVHLVARSPGGLAALLAVGELRALYLTAAIALFVGMRYAFSSAEGSPT